MPKFQILSISGGGFGGLFAARIIEQIEAQTKKPIGESFDLIAGTSIGGILALGIAERIPAITIRQQLEEHGPAIFSAKKKPSWMIGKFLDICKSTFSPKYRQTNLRAALEKILTKEATLAQLKTPTIIPAVNLTIGKPQLFKTPHHRNFRLDQKLRLIDVALATSAAPTYFPIHNIEGQQYVDGGLYANSPDELALHEARYYFKRDISDIHMLSIGTTTAQFSLPNHAGQKLGILGWVKDQRLASIMIASQQANTDSIMRHSLGERYIRIDRMLSSDQERSLSLDTADLNSRKELIGLADATSKKVVSNTKIIDLMSHRGVELN